jgi:hypothetical protein
MIADTDRLSLAPGVAVVRGQLGDSVRGTSWPLNPSGSFVLSRAGSSVGQTACDLAEAFSVPLETARADVLRFAWYLNALALVNVERQGAVLRRFADWVALAARLAPAGAFPAAVARRRALDTTSVRRAIASCLVAIVPRVLAVAAISLLVVLQFLAITGVPALGFPVLLGAAVGVGVGLHEAAHAAMLRGVPSALVTRGHRTFVLHVAISPARRSAVALAGPAAVAGIGLALALGGTGLEWPGLTLAGCPLAAHALALTVVCGDGRAACGI